MKSSKPLSQKSSQQKPRPLFPQSPSQTNQLYSPSALKTSQATPQKKTFANLVSNDEEETATEEDVELELYGHHRVCTCKEDPNWCELHSDFA